MLRSSLPFGRIFGVEVQVHVTFPLLLLLAMALSVFLAGGVGRGFALWLALCFAVFVRELARSLAAAWEGLHLRAIYLLPVGGAMAFSAADGATLQQNGARRTRWVTLSGPLANFGLGLLIFAFSVALDPRVALMEQPWISLTHILRSVVWTQFVLGAVSLLPAVPTRELLRSAADAGSSGKASVQTPGRFAANASAFSLGTAIAIAMILAGVLIPNFYWLIALGAFVLLYVQVTNVHTQATSDGVSILVREVMLTEYTLLSSSETLRGALDRTVHSLQDVFPVVRGDRLVGCIARQTIAERLVAGGDSYLQGAMQRDLHVATPDEPLVEALRRASTPGSGEFIPVVAGDALVGILTPQSLGRAVQQVNLLRPTPPPGNK